MMSYKYFLNILKDIYFNTSILLFFLLHLNLQLHSQDNIHFKYWETYYNLEECVIDSNYKKALEYYHGLYQQYEFIYANHAFMGLQLCALNADQKNSKKYIEQCYKSGILEDVIRNNILIKEHIPNFEQYHINYDSLRALYWSRINLEIREEIIKMDSLDNIATDKVNKSFLHYFQWRRVSKRNAKRIFEIIEKYGYPGEKLIGINQNQQLIDSLSEYKVGYNIFNHAYRTTNILVHYFSNHTRNYQDKNLILREELLKGNIEAADYAVLHDFQAQWKLTKLDNEFYYNVWHHDPHQRIKEINIRRKKIGLKPEDYQKKKKKYIIKNRKSGFKYIHIEYH